MNKNIYCATIQYGAYDETTQKIVYIGTNKNKALNELKKHNYADFLWLETWVGGKLIASKDIELDKDFK